MKPALPIIIDRMPLQARKPKAGPLLEPAEVIASAINYSLAFEWKGPVSENSVPVKAILDGLRYAGLKIVPMERGDYESRNH